MATKYEHPRIMLVEGVLGHPISGFSSLQSVNQVGEATQLVFH